MKLSDSGVIAFVIAFVIAMTCVGRKLGITGGVCSW